MEAVPTCTIAPDGQVDPWWSALHDVPMIDFLFQDRRPTFVVDLQQKLRPLEQPVSAILINPALRENKALFELVAGAHLDDSSADESGRQLFWEWLHGLDVDGATSEFQHPGFTWSCTTLLARWRVFVANPACNRCLGTAGEPKSTPRIKSLSQLAKDTHQYNDHPESDSAGPSSRPGSVSTSTSSKRSNPLGRARNFFAADVHQSEGQQTTQGDAVSAVAVSAAILNTDATNTSAYGIWSDIRVAKRNADLLAKISAFDGVGISIANNNGEIVFANDAWYKICGLSHGPLDAAAWMGIFEEAEVIKIAEVWKRITIEQEVAQFQTPLKWRWTPSAPSATDPGLSDFPVWISVWAYADVSPEGETVGCCSLVTDISQQKWTERVIERQLAETVERARALEQLSKDLTTSETRFRRLSDSMPHGIFMYSLDGKIVYANDAYRDIIPAAGDPTVLEPWWINVPEDEVAKATEMWRKLREEHVKVCSEMSILKFSVSPDGSTPMDERRYMTVSAYPEMDDNGDLKHITGCITDISHLRIAEQVQGARADDAEESKRQLEQFIDMTSHEIRNPLSAIIHSSEEVLAFLRSYPAQPTVTAVTNVMETVETIIDCINHSTRIVDDILIVSKLNSGLLTIAPTAVRLVAAVERTLRMFDGEIRAAGIAQSFTVDQSFDDLNIDWICLDVSRVLQILVNLISNAIKFTRPERVRRIETYLRVSSERPTNKPGHATPRYLNAQVEPSVTYQDSMTTAGEVVFVSISVTDTGCGMSEDEQKNLFRRFSQAGNRTHVKYGGTGLGLFISRQLCEMQGGQIGLHSAPGQGSVFTFYVQASKSRVPGNLDSKASAVGLRVGTQQAPASTPEVISSPGLGTIISVSPCDQTILLVEDNLINQKVAAKLLRGKGFVVRVANHGAEALEHIRHSALLSGALATAPPISLILLDIEMPVMDGLTCIRRIRKMENSGELRFHVPVVAITANARQEQIDQAKSAGMDSVVTKPFRIDQLLDVMAQLWQQHPTEALTRT